MKNRSFLRIALRFGRGKLSVLAAVMLAAVLLFPGCPYYKSAFRGKVVDAETGEPVEGAVVAAVYRAVMYNYCCIPAVAGPSPSEIDVRETLTGGDGMFRILPYATIMPPISTGYYTHFVIFKPGYGRFPGFQTSPPFNADSDLERFFSGKFGAEGTAKDERNRGEPKTVPVTFGVVKLPKLKTWEEREKSLPSWPHNRAPLLREMDRRECEWLRRNKGWKR